MRKQTQACLIYRVIGSHQYLGLSHSAAILFIGAKRDPSGKHMTLWCHQSERFFIGVEHQHACGKLHAARHRQVAILNLARSNTCEWSIETVARWPEPRKMFLPGLDDLPWLHNSTFQTNTISFLPHLTEAL